MFSAFKRFLSPRYTTLFLLMGLLAGIPSIAATSSCPDHEAICPVDRVWTEQELKALTTLPAPRGYAFIVDESGLTLI